VQNPYLRSVFLVHNFYFKRMQAYITQLLADLKAAESRERPTKPDYKILYPDHPAADPQYEGELDHIIEWEMGIGYTAEALFGIPTAAFPPADKLTAEDIFNICDAILALWAAYNITVTFPDDCDDTVLYQYLVEEWDTGNFPLLDKYSHCGKETCHYDPEDCRWKAQCTCRVMFEEMEHNERAMKAEQTPEEKAHYEKGLKHHPNGGISWVNPDLLDENGNFDPSKLGNMRFPDEDDEADDELPS
jgi:hypothetical protein